MPRPVKAATAFKAAKAATAEDIRLWRDPDRVTCLIIDYFEGLKNHTLKLEDFAKVTDIIVAAIDIPDIYVRPVLQGLIDRRVVIPNGDLAAGQRTTAYTLAFVPYPTPEGYTRPDPPKTLLLRPTPERCRVVLGYLLRQPGGVVRHRPITADIKLILGNTEAAVNAMLTEMASMGLIGRMLESRRTALTWLTLAGYDELQRLHQS